MHAVLRQVFDTYTAQLSGKPAEWCQLHPLQDERLWSAQELVEHLVLTCRSTSRVLDKRIERGHATSDRGTPVQWFLQLIVLSFGHMPRGAPAPTFARPDQLHWPATNGDTLVDLLRQEIDAMDTRLDRCRERFGQQRVATHFILGPLRTDQWRRFHVIHLRHHLGQLRRLEQSIGGMVANDVSATQA